MISDKFLDALESVLPLGIQNAKKSDVILKRLASAHNIKIDSRALQFWCRALIEDRKVPCGAVCRQYKKLNGKVGYFVATTLEEFKALQANNTSRKISLQKRIDALNVAWRNRKQQALGIEDSEARLPPSTLATGQNEHFIRVNPSERDLSAYSPQTSQGNSGSEGTNGKPNYAVLKEVGNDYFIRLMILDDIEKRYKSFGIDRNFLEKFMRDYGKKHDCSFRSRGPKTNLSPTFDDYEMLERWNLACDDWEKDRLTKTIKEA